MALFPQPSHEKLLAHYPAEYYGSSPRKFVAPVAKMISLFQGQRARRAARCVPPGGRVLDIGCGNGGFLFQMKQRGFRVEGTEWNVESAARLPQDQRIKVHVGDLIGLDLPDESYDLITLWHVLEHVRAPHQTLRRIRRMLKAGGSLLISLPNAESRQAKRFASAWLHHDPPRHLFGFGPKSMRQLLEWTGFEVTSIKTSSLEQNPFGYIQSWLNERGHPRDRLYSILKGTSRATTRDKIVDLAWMSILLAPAVAASSVESATGYGATMTIHARA